MKRKHAIKLWSALFGALLLPALPSQAGIRTVTSLGTNYNKNDAKTAGTYTYEVQHLQDGDTLMFAGALADKILYQWESPFTGSQDGMSFTIIGNGITMADDDYMPGEVGVELCRYTGKLKQLVVENMRFCTSVAVGGCETVHFKHCIFKNGTGGSQMLFLDRSMTNAIVESCAFLATEGGSKAYNINANGDSDLSVHLVSCTFYTNAVYSGGLQNYGNILNTLACKSVALTGCVLIDEVASASHPSVRLAASTSFVSKGYNVIHGLVGTAYDANAPWKQPTDACFSPETAVDILTCDPASGVYKVHVGTAADTGPAYRRLPPNPNNLVPDVNFPGYDLAGTEIDYSKATHSGAWQAIDGEDLAIEEAATGIIISSGNATDIAAAEMFSEETLQLNASVTPNNVPQAVRWESDRPEIASIDGNGRVTAPVAGYTEPQTVTLTCTTTEAKDAGDQFLSATVTLTVKPYVHVSTVTLPDGLALTVGISCGLRAAIGPANANNPALTWTVDNSRVHLTVVSNDTVTLRGTEPCTAVVTATAADGSIAGTCNVTVSHANYTDGVFFINEDWYPLYSTINFLHSDGRWDYRIFQAANPDNGEGQPFTLGVTAQFATIYGDKIYTVCKQPGNSHAFASDARTMQVVRYDTPWTKVNLPSSDGRAYLQVNDSIGYESTSNGIIKYDYVRREYTPVAGTGTGGGLYTGQAGTMRRVGDFVFAVQQNVGLLVIDAHNHTVFRTLTDYNYATLTQSKDGYLWTGTTKYESQGSLNEETVHNVIVRIDPWTLEQTEILLPEGAVGPASTWGAWQFDPIWGSTKENVLYWASGKGKKILRYDIDANTAETVLDLTGYVSPDGRGPSNTSGGWAMYGTGFGIHPATDELYVSTSLYNLSAPSGERSVWQVLKVDPHTKQITGTYPLTDHYWFIAMPVFPDNHAPEFTAVPFPAKITIDGTHPADTLRLGDKVTDRDNMDAAIIISIDGGYDKSLINPRIWRDSLIVAARKTIPTGQPAEKTTLTLKFNSNGHTITKTVEVTVQPGVTVPDQPGEGSIEENPFELTQQTLTLYPKQTAQLALTAPQHFSVAWYSTATSVATVTQTGLVTTLAAGTALIIARDAAKGKADTCLVTVNELPATPPAYTLALNTSDLRLVVGQRSTLQLTVTPLQAGRTAVWTTSDPKVADISSSGTVIARAAGTAQITVTLGTVSALCIVIVSPEVTQLTVNDVGQDGAQLVFPKVSNATYYLAHLYELKGGAVLPALTLKVTPDGRVSLRAAAGTNLVVPLSYLSPGVSYVAQVETVRETGGRAEVIRTEVVSFTTLKTPTGLSTPKASTVHYADGTLRLEGLEGYGCVLTSVSGQTLRRLRVESASEWHPLALPAGMYILTATGESRRQVFKFVVR